MKPKTTTAIHANLLARLENNDDDAIDEFGHIRMLSRDTLLAAALGDIDLNDIARFFMADSGYDREGCWVGFDAAKRAWTAGDVA